MACRDALQDSLWVGENHLEIIERTRGSCKGGQRVTVSKIHMSNRLLAFLAPVNRGRHREVASQVIEPVGDRLQVRSV